MNKKVNLPFLAYLAYLAGLLTLSVLLSSCSTTTKHVQSGGGVHLTHAKQNGACPAYY